MSDQNLLNGQQGDDCDWLIDLVGQAIDDPEMVIPILERG